MTKAMAAAAAVRIQERLERCAEGQASTRPGRRACALRSVL
jgi:hypothetical protein